MTQPRGYLEAAITDSAPRIEDIIAEQLARALSERTDDFWHDHVEGEGTGTPQGILTATKISAYMNISDEVLHPERYHHEPVKVSRRLRFRWWRQRTRETVGYWIAGHDPDDDDDWR